MVFPSAYFVYFNDQVIRLLDANTLTPDNYRDLMERSERMREVIVEISQHRKH
jgi:hypothetical protein